MAKSYLGWVLPGLFFTVGFGFAACVGDNDSNECEPSAVATGGGGGAGGAGGSSPQSGSGAQSAGDPETSQDGDNNFHHPMDPTQPGQADPFEILKKRAAEGPPEVRSRLHSCSKLTYSSLGTFLTSRGVNLDAVAPAGQPPTAGQLYKSSASKDALGAANFDAKMGEAYFYTISAATKLFDIFVQAAPEIIENAKNSEACKINGTGYAVFNDKDKCTYYGLSCIMGRPATDDDMELCNLMVSQANAVDAKDLANKKALTVAAFLAAAHTCQ